MSNRQRPSHTRPTQVAEPSDLRKWRTELPNLIDDLGLSIYAYRLYGHLKRRAGADGSTIEGLRAMAKHCGMAVGTAAKARKELLEKELIFIEEITNEHGRFDRITIVDIWEQNFRHFTEMRERKSKALSDEVYHQTAHPPVSPDEMPGVSPNPQGELPLDTPPVSPDGTHKKEPGEERTLEERTHTHGARVRGNGDSRKVCVCPTPHASKLCDEERIRIASNMVGVKIPERYAMTSDARRGTYDTIFLKRQKELQKLSTNSQPERDTSACPDCHGKNFICSVCNSPNCDALEHRTKGVKRCEHPRLDEELARLESEYKANREELNTQ